MNIIKGNKIDRCVAIAEGKPLPFHWLYELRSIYSMRHLISPLLIGSHLQTSLAYHLYPDDLLFRVREDLGFKIAPIINKDKCISKLDVNKAIAPDQSIKDYLLENNMPVNDAGEAAYLWATFLNYPPICCIRLREIMYE